MTNIRDFIGKRCLLKIGMQYHEPIGEYKVLEVSPSGNFVKVMNLNGNKFWKGASEVLFIEELQDLKAERERLQDDPQTSN